MTLAVDFPRGAAVAGPRRLAVSGFAPWTRAATAVLAASLLAAVLGPVLHGHPAAPEDDAEYYRVIAAHIAHRRVDLRRPVPHQRPPPLWEAVLVLQNLTAGPSFLVTQLIEVVADGRRLPAVPACGRPAVGAGDHRVPRRLRPLRGRPRPDRDGGLRRAAGGPGDDREYLQAVKAGGDVTPLLCRRGVRFVIATGPSSATTACTACP